MALLLFWAAALSPVYAQQACGKRVNVLGHLEDKYQERPIAIGLANNGGVVELLTNDDGKTWTLIVTMPNGISCLLASGEDWEKVLIRLGRES